MRALIKTSKWVNFIYEHMAYGFMTDTNPKTKETMYVRNVGRDDNDPIPVYLIITMDRELHLVTPMGESPFMESQQAHYKDLLDDDMIEYVKGAFD